MRLQCVETSGLALPDRYLDAAGGYTKELIFPLSVGMNYPVYAMTLRRGGVWYYVQDDRQLEYPVWYPAPLFEVVDARLSRYWTFALHRGGARDGDAVFAFPEWANDPFTFYYALSDGDASARQAFRRFKELMELEFATDDTGANALDLGDGWFQCARCSDAWQTTALGQRVRCPNCGLVQGNPRLT